MRQVFALLLTLFACVICGCTPWGSGSLTPPVAQATQTEFPPCADPCQWWGRRDHFAFDSKNASTREQSGSGYVYVADGKAKALLVYRFGFAGALIASVPLDGAPFGVAVSRRTGRVYVTEQQVSVVQVFDRGAAHAIGHLNGANEPGGITVVDGKVYVANLFDKQSGSTGEFGSVTVYDEGSPNAVKSFPAPLGWGVRGVAVDSHGNRFETLIDKAANGLLVEYAPNAQGDDLSLIAKIGRPTWGGVTVDDFGNVIVGDNGSLTTFEKPDFTRSHIQAAPELGILTYFTHSELGTFVPVNAGAGKSQVVVYPASGAVPYYVLKAGMETPLGAAGGV